MTQEPPILALKNASLSFGDKHVLESASAGLLPRDRACLVGRNGCGKSTLLKVLAGKIELDQGERFIQPGKHTSLLGQTVLPNLDITALEYIQSNSSTEIQPYEIEDILDALQSNPKSKLNTLSGGESRRIALACALVTKPDVLLLDEPTNHLDVRTIEWLESQVKNYRGAILMISHDRSFLTNLSQRTFWLDRGQLRTLEKGYRHFDEWSEQILETEAAEQSRLEQKIAQEMVWLHKGVTARRKRNMGRLRHLQTLRKEKAQRTGPQGSLQFTTLDNISSSKRVIEAHKISKSYIQENGTEKRLIHNFSTRIIRGDRIGIIGPNGSGKTTLINLLTGKIKPDSGKVKLSKALQLAKFDQDHSSLNLDETPWETLCPEGGDQVMVQGSPRHVMGYLQDFLFDRNQARSPLRSLSGGERNRLLLAKILAEPSTLLVLDEPTNDLDMDSLDLLQEYIDEYPGTLLIVSHDRDFLDRTTSSLIVMGDNGGVQEYVGGYSDYLRARSPADPSHTSQKKEQKIRPAKSTQKKKLNRLSYKDARDRELLPEHIETLTRKVHLLEEQLMDPKLFQADPDKFHQLTHNLTQTKEELHKKEERWLEVEMMAEKLKE